MTLPTTRELLLAWDRQRPRSLQAEIGMSALGRCRRQTGYKLGRYPADEGYTSAGIQAILGTAVHEVAAEAARLGVPGAHAENLEVSFGGLRGHPDLWVDGVCRDVKTKGYTLQIENIRQNGPPQGERWQVMVYGAGLIIAGYPVHTIEIDYIARDSGEDYLWREPFDPVVVAAAMAWLQDVRTADPELLPRDYRPDSATCKGCEFFTRCWQMPRGSEDRAVLFIDNPDVAHWAGKLQAAQAVRKRAEAEEKDAKGALDFLRSVSRPGEEEFIAVPGMDKDIRIKMNKGRQSPDMPQIASDYKRAGARPPMKTGEPIVSITLVKPKEPSNADREPPGAGGHGTSDDGDRG